MNITNEETGFEFTQTFEPQKNNRFMIKFNPPFEIESFAVHKMSELKTASIHNDGKVYWEDLTLSLFETTDKPTSGKIYKGLVANRANNENVISFRILELNIVGSTIQTWEVEASIKSIKFGRYDWSDDSTRTIEMILNHVKARVL
jgi:hypothetical protein